MGRHSQHRISLLLPKLGSDFKILSTLVCYLTLVWESGPQQNVRMREVDWMNSFSRNVNHIQTDRDSLLYSQIAEGQLCFGSVATPGKDNLFNLGLIYDSDHHLEATFM